MRTADHAEGERMQCMEVWGGNMAADKALRMPGLRAWLSSAPYEQAEQGGDVYYLSSCASGRITRMLLADVSGHGIGVSRLAIKLRDLMRGNVNLINQTTFVSAMNQRFTDAANDGGFATAIVLTFFAPSKTLQLCNAGHPGPLMFRAATKTWSISEQPQRESKQGPVDLPLGVLNESEYTRSELTLEPGDAVLCYSDAFSEAEDAKGEMLGVEGLLKLVRTIDEDDPAQFCGALRNKVRELEPTNLEQDDSTVLLIQADGSSATVGDSLKAPFRMFTKATDNTQFREDNRTES